ncbi:hypothetical protein BDA96_10G225700 [Sorghum bicolor]|uniref:Uncharacterized protein n=1 Tax=Sorghum bicolor TaxID=4558 RepID=A0A921Q3H4_SORBI|nr:hypothetical protein BDA96_10G225700 [Sorghum bicolor]
MGMAEDRAGQSGGRCRWKEGTRHRAGWGWTAAPVQHDDIQCKNVGKETTKIYTSWELNTSYQNHSLTVKSFRPFLSFFFKLICRQNFSDCFQFMIQTGPFNLLLLGSYLVRFTRYARDSNIISL